MLVFFTDICNEHHHKGKKDSKRFRNIKLCIFLSGLSVFAQLYLFQPLLPMVAEHFNRSVGDSSLLVSSATIGMALGLFSLLLKPTSFQGKSLWYFLYWLLLYLLLFQLI